MQSMHQRIFCSKIGYRNTHGREHKFILVIVILLILFLRLHCYRIKMSLEPLLLGFIYGQPRTGNVVQCHESSLKMKEDPRLGQNTCIWQQRELVPLSCPGPVHPQKAIWPLQGTLNTLQHVPEVKLVMANEISRMCFNYVDHTFILSSKEIVLIVGKFYLRACG